MDIEENITNNIFLRQQQMGYYFKEMIFTSLQFYSNYGQLIRNTQIKKMYGHHINNIDLMIKIGVHIFIIHCIYEKSYPDINKIKSFFYDCTTIKNIYNNHHLIFHKIYLTKYHVSFNTLNFLNENNIINIHLHNNHIKNICSDSDHLIQMNILLNKLYYYIADTTKIYTGLKSLDSDDVIMTNRSFF